MYYFCSWDKISYNLGESYELDKQAFKLAASPENSSSEFSEMCCTCFDDGEYEEICKNYKTKKLFFNDIEYTYALIWCYGVYINPSETLTQISGICHSITVKIVEMFQIWTLIDSEENHPDAEKLENLIYLSKG